jgi:NAD(P)-dependent dehydrogenase (short-subunit alcohol dehydrogenase family)
MQMLYGFAVYPPASHDAGVGPRTVPAVKQLAGTAAVVTGAASGIGLAITEAFVAEGIRVVMADVAAAPLDGHVRRLRDLGAQVEGVVVDVSDPDAVDRAGRAAVEHFGALHIAVNNAGIVNRGNSWELSLEEWRRVLDVNLWGVIHGIRSFVPLILASGAEGHIVNVASMAAVLPLDRLGPYTVAKHGVLGLSDVLHAELDAIAAPVGVSVVMPGGIKTGMNPTGAVAASDVAINVVDAVRRGRRYVFTDRQSSRQVEARLQAILASRADVLT